MSEKVKVTKEQAEAIERALKFYGEDQLVDKHCLLQKNKDFWVGSFEGMNDLEMWKLARSIYIGYEVEPEFLIGDTVINKETGIIEEVDGYMTTILEKHSENYRHATPEEIAAEKERRWWRKHGRDVLEFKTNDIVSYDCNAWGGIYTVYSDIYSWDSFKNRLIKVSNRHMHNGRVLSFRADKLKVMCFVENRLDVSE